MKELLSLLKLLVITDKLARCLKVAVKGLICAMLVLSAVSSVKLICGLKTDGKRRR